MFGVGIIKKLVIYNFQTIFNELIFNIKFFMWKNWPYWVRGGIIGLIANLLLVIDIYTICLKNVCLKMLECSSLYRPGQGICRQHANFLM